ncbi:MAG: cytochrome c [Vicinamibacterales bacterium]
MRFRVTALVFGGILAAVSGRATVGAQAPTVPEGKIWTGVYSAEQAAQGENTFGSMCARCHASDLSGGQVAAAYAPALGGEKFLASWESRNVGRLFRTIKDTMPRGSAGLLSDAGAAELVAYILKYNGFPSGSAALAADMALLESVTIIPKPGAVKREASNFSTVQATGCLVRGGGNSWALTKATAPLPSRVDSPIVAIDSVSGAETFRLVSTGAFALDSRTGERVTVKGVIRRDQDETLINVVAIEPSGARCN